MNVQQVQLRNSAPESDQHSMQLIGRLLIAAGALRPAGALRQVSSKSSRKCVLLS